MNKRRCGRQPCRVPVEACKGSVFDHVTTVDIGRGGMGCVADRVVRVNERIAVELLLSPDAEPVLVKGRVKWISKEPGAERYRFGLAFSRLDEH